MAAPLETGQRFGGDMMDDVAVALPLVPVPRSLPSLRLTTER